MINGQTFNLGCNWK